ncbi:photoreceptor ankyrin repeat protein isoform X2 [Marmota marmota marmota]|uniref:photoreceptor ankyrin repeat protein isoform X2 n=1 Tax=Marmota marmota marmota TaxID=9994 RepID=UPI0020923535|nr:photoreceptor ankyrin repeat protein isoform X2 [Marmota marmota marmota]
MAKTEHLPLQVPNPFLTGLTQLSPEVFAAALSEKVQPAICYLHCFLGRDSPSSHSRDLVSVLVRIWEVLLGPRLCHSSNHLLRTLRAPGADLTSVDPVRGKTALEWALLTDSFDTVQRIRQLLQRPRVEQLSQHYQLEWPALPGLVAQAQAQAQVAPSFLERLQSTLSFSFAQSPQEGGVLDHLVTITTGLASPFLATACHTLCPDYPPALGTRSKSVPELLGTAPPPPPVPQPPQEVPGPRVFVPYQSPQGMFSQWLQPRSSTSTRSQVPKILLSKAPSAPRQYKFMSKSSGHNNLVLPLWRYQELRLERKRQEEARLAQDQGKMG